MQVGARELLVQSDTDSLSGGKERERGREIHVHASFTSFTAHLLMSLLFMHDMLHEEKKRKAKSRIPII